MTQPTALFLADVMHSDPCSKAHHDAAAAELRRLHAKCEALTADTIEEMRRINELYELTAQRDALLEALREIESATVEGGTINNMARAAIAKAEGEKA